MSKLAMMAETRQAPGEELARSDAVGADEFGKMVYVQND